MSNFLESVLKPAKTLPPPAMDFPFDGLGDLPYSDPSMDPLGGSSLPPPSSYGSVQPSFNEKIAELAIGTSLKIDGKPITNIDELPTLFYFLTDNWRHFQLSNLKKADQREIQRSLEDIRMLSGQMGNEYLCKLKQIELFDSIYLFKSRSDLDSDRERVQWTIQTNNMNTQSDIKRPREGSGGGLMSFFTGKNKGDY